MALKPFRLTAQMLRGVVADENSLDLAGILASRMWRQMKHAPAVDSMVERPEDFDLPLHMCEHGEDWHWMGSAGEFDADALRPQEPRTHYRVVNDAWAARAADRPLPYYHPRSSAYRDMMMPAHVVLTPTITWYGVGNPEAIMDLVSPIRELGKRRMKGEGRVLSWEIEEVLADDSWVYGHIGDSDSIVRPIPVECANRLGVEYDLAWHAIRPPSWNPNRLRRLAVKPEEEVYLPEEWEL